MSEKRSNALFDGNLVMAVVGTTPGVPDQLNVQCLESGNTYRYLLATGDNAKLAEHADKLEQELAGARGQCSWGFAERDRIRNQWARVCGHRDELLAKVKERDTALDNAAKRIKWLEDKVAGLESQAEHNKAQIATLRTCNDRQSETIGSQMNELYHLRSKPLRVGADLGKIRELTLQDNNGFLHRFFDPQAVTLIF